MRDDFNAQAQSWAFLLPQNRAGVLDLKFAPCWVDL